jgi:hypothetical protein
VFYEIQEKRIDKGSVSLVSLYTRGIEVSLIDQPYHCHQGTGELFQIDNELRQSLTTMGKIYFHYAKIFQYRSLTLEHLCERAE